MAKRPAGVTIVAALTLMSAIALGFLQLLLIALLAVVGPTPIGSTGLPSFSVLPGFFAAFALILSVGQLTGAKWVWYASIVFWSMILAYFVQFAYTIDFSHGIVWLDRSGYFIWYGFQEFLVSLIPLIYGAGCLAYFLTKSPRNYFKV